MDKKERERLRKEYSSRSTRDLVDVLLQAEEAIEQRNRRLARLREMTNRKFMREVADALEAVMSTDPEMPSHEGTMRDAERVLEALREKLKD